MSFRGRPLIKSFQKAMETNRVIVVGRLSPRSSPAVVKSFFENYGSVYQVYRPINTALGKYTSNAYVQFYDEEVVLNILQQRNAQIDMHEVEMRLCDHLPFLSSNKKRQDNLSDKAPTIS